MPRFHDQLAIGFERVLSCNLWPQQRSETRYRGLRLFVNGRLLCEGMRSFGGKEKTIDLDSGDYYEPWFIARRYRDTVLWWTEFQTQHLCFPIDLYEAMCTDRVVRSPILIPGEAEILRKQIATYMSEAIEIEYSLTDAVHPLLLRAALHEIVHDAAVFPIPDRLGTPTMVTGGMAEAGEVTIEVAATETEVVGRIVAPFLWPIWAQLSSSVADQFRPLCEPAPATRSRRRKPKAD